MLALRCVETLHDFWSERSGGRWFVRLLRAARGARSGRRRRDSPGHETCRMSKSQVGSNYTFLVWCGPGASAGARPRGETCDGRAPSSERPSLVVGWAALVSKPLEVPISFAEHLGLSLGQTPQRHDADGDAYRDSRVGANPVQDLDYSFHNKGRCRVPGAVGASSAESTCRRDCVAMQQSGRRSHLTKGVVGSQRCNAVSHQP